MSSATLHVVSLPHTQTTSEHLTCAYTQKVLKFCRMMHGRGRRIVLYSGDRNEAPCDEHVVCVSSEEQERWFGSHDENDLERGGFRWDDHLPWWRQMNARAAAAIAERADKHDLLLLIAGSSQQLVADRNPALTVAEWGVGYEGWIGAGGLRPRQGGPAYCAFESYAFMHLVYGLWQMRHARFYDTVIPNFFDPAEFPAVGGNGRGEYLLFLGRVIEHKGPAIAALIARQLGMKLIVAGPGGVSHGPGWVQAPELLVRSPGLEYVGPVGVQERNELLQNAVCLLAPTTFIEPFGGVAVEAMMAGCPAVTTDFGAFTETVQPGVSGYRFSTLAEGCRAVSAAAGLDRQAVRGYAEERYSLEAVRPCFEHWFERLDGLWEGGWLRPSFARLPLAPAAPS